MNNKYDELLQFLGVVSTMLVIVLFISNCMKLSYINKLERSFYDVEEQILEMSKENDRLFKAKYSNDMGTYNDCDAYTDVLREYEDIIEGIKRDIEDSYSKKDA